MLANAVVTQLPSAAIIAAAVWRRSVNRMFHSHVIELNEEYAGSRWKPVRLLCLCS